MSDPLTMAPLKWLGEKGLDLLADQLEKKILKRIDPAILQIQEELKDIRNAQDQTLIAPFREGLTQFQLGEPAKARDILVKADSMNPHAPLPKLWLALILLKQNNNQREAYEYLSRALRLNPYSILEHVGEVCLQEVGLTAGGKQSEALVVKRPWSLSLANERFNSSLVTRFKWPKKTLQKYFGVYSSRSTAAIAGASVCGDHVAIKWLLGDNLRHGVEEVLALFNLKSQEPVWARLNKNEDLVFLTYQHVVVYLRERNSYSLLDYDKGDSINKMSQDYFGTLFGRSGEKSAAFIRANWQGTARTDAYEKSARFIEPRVSTMDTTFGHYPRLFSEGATLYDPCGMNPTPLTVINRWNHVHFQGGATLLPSCRLVGGATIGIGEGANISVRE
jgi:hypothetical protein